MLPQKLAGIPADLSVLLEAVARDFPAILKENLVGIYLWGSLTYDAFDARCSDVDMIVVTNRDPNQAEFSNLEHWFAESLAHNPWARRLDVRFVIDAEFLDKNSRCCGFHEGRLTRHGSDGNPIIWLNIGSCGTTLFGADAGRIAPAIPDEILDAALRLELNYLEEGLTKNAGDRSVPAFRYNAYAVLTAGRILYTAHLRKLVSKEQALTWVKAVAPSDFRSVIEKAWSNRLCGEGVTTPETERSAQAFVLWVRDQVRTVLATAEGTSPDGIAPANRNRS